MDIKEIVLVSVIDKDGIEPLLTKAFTNKDEAEKYFISMIKDDLSRKYDEDEDMTDEINACLDFGCYHNEYGLNISISEIGLSYVV